MYLVARQIDPNNLLTEWKGRKGKFVRTFGFNDERNNNEWRVTWESIKEHISTALGRPGIEFMNCDAMECTLDHVEAESFEENIEKQKPFARTTIIDYIPDEDTHTMDLIHEVHDDIFWEKLKTGEIKWVSPMVWPAEGGFEVSGTGRAGLPIIDAWHWKYVHHAFLEKNPAYGTVAGIKTMCEGDNCGIQMMSAKMKQLSAETISAPGDVLNPLKEIPLLYRHKKQLHFVTASQKVKDMIVQRKKDGVTIDDKELAAIFTKCEDKLNENSFKTCNCKKNIKMPEITQEEANKMKEKLTGMEKDNKDLEAKLKGMEMDEDKKFKDTKAKYAKLFGMTKSEDEEKNISAAVKGMEDEKEMKAMDEALKEHKAIKSMEKDDPKMEAMFARVKDLESEKSASMINGLVALRKFDKMDDDNLREFETGLKASTFDEIKLQFKNEEYRIKALPAKEISGSQFGHFEFPDVAGLVASSQELGGLAAKTINEHNHDEDTE